MHKTSEKLVGFFCFCWFSRGFFSFPKKQDLGKFDEICVSFVSFFFQVFSSSLFWFPQKILLKLCLSWFSKEKSKTSLLCSALPGCRTVQPTCQMLWTWQYIFNPSIV